MSWGTDFNTDIFLTNMVFNSKYQVEEEIEERQKNMEGYKAKLKMYASSTPKDVVAEE